MHSKDIGKLLSAVLKSFKKFIEDEKQHPVGRVNLGFGVLATLFLFFGLFPTEVLVAIRVFLGKEVSEFEFYIPMIAFIVLLGFFFMSLKLIPPKNPNSPEQ